MIVCLTPSLTVTTHLADPSVTLPPDLPHPGFNNGEIRLHLQTNVGEHSTEYSEKEAARREELRMRNHL